jgi:S-adenosyl methyltransferase
VSEEWYGQPPTEPVVGPNYFHKPSPARMWNYLQGGKDHYPLDRAAGDAMVNQHPDMFNLAKQTRRFLMRAVHYLAETEGVRQFLDIGCGLPAPADLANVHDVAQAVHTDSRVVYVDNDKVVLAHARALMTSLIPDAGPIDYIDADVRDVEHILSESAKTFDFSKPAAICLLGVLGHVGDVEEACAIVDKLLAAFPSGSFLIVADGFDDGDELRKGVADRNDTGIDHYHLRTMAQFERYFRGLELLEPGIGSISLWRPGPVEVGKLPEVFQYGGVGRKP